MSRGLRNNNPLNIRLSRTPWQGEVRPSKDKAFCTFVSPAYGYRAAIRLIQNYVRLYHCDTISRIITRWAPPSENNTKGYIYAVCKLTGLKEQTRIDASDKATMCALVAAMSRVENGKEAVREDVEAGWALT